jgi:hypothetical protein
VAAQLGAGGQVRGASRQNALEAEHQPEAHLPLGRRLSPAGFQLGERFVQRASSRRSGRERDGWIFVGMEERLACPRFSACCGLGESVRCLRRYGRVLGRVLHARDASCVATF